MTAALLLGWMVIALLTTVSVQLYRSRVATPLESPPAAGVAVVIPIKGMPGSNETLANCLAQRGVAYRIIFAVESRDDPAADPIVRLAAAGAPVSLVVAGRAKERGQKVHNQLAALATLRPQDRFVVFADADIVPAPDWLAQLLRPLLLGRTELASGYRWILPADDHLASRACALIDWGVATAPRSRRWNLCWGGSIAITRAALDRIDLPRAWNNTLLDDIVLTRAARRAGITVYAPHRVLVPSPVRHDLRSLFDFGRRQYLLVRVHAPLHWWLAGATLIIPTAASLAALRGDWPAIGCLVVALGLQQLRANLRVAVAWRVLPTDAAAAAAALVRRDRWLLPVFHLVHLAIWLSSAVGRTMTWAGRRYRLLGFGKVEISTCRASGLPAR